MAWPCCTDVQPFPAGSDWTSIHASNSGGDKPTAGPWERSRSAGRGQQTQRSCPGCQPSPAASPQKVPATAPRLFLKFWEEMATDGTGKWGRRGATGRTLEKRLSTAPRQGGRRMREGSPRVAPCHVQRKDRLTGERAPTRQPHASHTPGPGTVPDTAGERRPQTVANSLHASATPTAGHQSRHIHSWPLPVCGHLGDLRPPCPVHSGIPAPQDIRCSCPSQRWGN